MYNNTKTAPANGLTTERLLTAVRIIMSSPALRHPASDFRPHAANIALAKRTGVGIDDQRLKLVAAMWASIIMTAQGDLGPDTDWEHLSVDEVISRIENTFSQFVDLITDVRQPV